MNHNKDKLAIIVAKLYYRSEYSQQRIAEELQISRPSVSRLLQYAKEKGFVRIQIYDPVEDTAYMERRLEEQMHLQKVCIAVSTINDEEEIKNYIAMKAAEYLNSIVQDGDIIGVGWGTTLYNMSRCLIPQQLRGAQIVQLEGGVTHSKWKNYSREILENFANNYSTIAQYLPLPVLFSSLQVKQMVDQDRHIKRVLEMGRQANIAIFSAGTVRPDALFFRLDYTDEDEKAMIQQSAVGDICSRFFNSEGNICTPKLDARTVGITLEELRKKEHSILVAGGAGKVEAIRAALKGHYANVFITDQFTAKALLGEKTDFD